MPSNKIKIRGIAGNELENERERERGSERVRERERLRGRVGEKTQRNESQKASCILNKGERMSQIKWKQQVDLDRQFFHLFP